ncbi:MAG TPA: GNAT family N-acetyltransferase [Alphaproteobacteria bacterium]|nr:GNAT family N-acetyltransferase [Alphaproteobacteria bacterium]
MFDCKILTSEADVEAIAEEWRQLQASIGDSPFTGYHWFDIWWKTIGKQAGRDLHIVTGRLNGRLVALFPLVIVRRLGARILQGSDRATLYQSGMLCADIDHARELWAAARRSPFYDFADIRDVQPGSACARVLDSFARRRDTETNHFLKLTWKTEKEWLASLSSGMRTGSHRRLRRLEEKGAVCYEVYQTEPPPPTVIDAMIKQKIAWCRAHGENQLFNHSGVLEFYHKLVEMAARQGTLFLVLLKCGNDTIAYRLCFLHQKVAYGYIISYDLGWKQYSPGTLLVMHSIGWAIANGFREFNFMQGEGAHKSQYTDDSRNWFEYTFSASHAGHLREMLYIGARDAWRKIKDLRRACARRRGSGTREET